MYHAFRNGQITRSEGWMEAHLTRAMLGGAPMAVTSDSHAAATGADDGATDRPANRQLG